MILNKKQKEFLIKDFIGSRDTYKIFDCLEVSWPISQKLEIKPSTTMSGWYDLFMNGEKYTSLNFRTYPEKLEELKNIK